MQKILISLISMCFVFALVGCGGSSSYNEDTDFIYLGVWEEGIPMELTDENGNPCEYVYKGKTVSAEGMELLVIENLNEPNDTFLYKNDPVKGVFCGYEENGKAVIAKIFDYHKSTWEACENILCTKKNESCEVCTISATDGKDTLIFYYNICLGLIDTEKSKTVLDYDNMSLDDFLNVIKNACVENIKEPDKVLKILEGISAEMEEKINILKATAKSEEDRDKLNKLVQKYSILRNYIKIFKEILLKS